MPGQKFTSRESYDNLLKVPEINAVGDMPSGDMDELLKVNTEMFNVDVSQETIESLLNVESFYPTITVTDTGEQHFIKLFSCSC